MKDLEFIKGNNRFGRFKIKDEDGNIITDANIIMVCRLQPDETSPIIFEKTTADGQIVYRDEYYRFEINEEDTKDMLTNVNYGYEIKCEYKGSIKSKIGIIKLNHRYVFGNEE